MHITIIFLAVYVFERCLVSFTVGTSATTTTPTNVQPETLYQNGNMNENTGPTVDPIIISIVVLVVVAVILVIAVIAFLLFGLFYYSIRQKRLKVIGDFQSPSCDSPQDIVSSSSSEANLDSPCVINVDQSLASGHLM